MLVEILQLVNDDDVELLDGVGQVRDCARVDLHLCVRVGGRGADEGAQADGRGNGDNAGHGDGAASFLSLEVGGGIVRGIGERNGKKDVLRSKKRFVPGMTLVA